MWEALIHAIETWEHDSQNYGENYLQHFPKRKLELKKIYFRINRFIFTARQSWNNMDFLQMSWSILKVISKTDLSYLLSLVFVSLSLVFVHVLFSAFDFFFLLVLEFTYCHIKNLIRLALSVVRFLQIGVMNGPLKFLTARKISPLLKLLAKFKRVLACSCSQK